MYFCHEAYLLQRTLFFYQPGSLSLIAAIDFSIHSFWSAVKKKDNKLKKGNRKRESQNDNWLYDCYRNVWDFFLYP